MIEHEVTDSDVVVSQKRLSITPGLLSQDSCEKRSSVGDIV